MKKDNLLQNFIEEHFDIDSLIIEGFIDRSKRYDYKAIEKRICDFFGIKSIYEYGAKELRAHISYDPGKRPLYINENGKLIEEPFVTVIPSIYDNN